MSTRFSNFAKLLIWSALTILVGISPEPESAEQKRRVSAGKASDPEEKPATGLPDPSEQAETDAVDALKAAAARCRTRWEEIAQSATLKGAPGFEAKRGPLLARAKAEPIFFVQTPEYDDAVSGEIKHYRSSITTSRNHWGSLKRHLRYFRNRPEKGRQVLLRDGYLYAEDPRLAFALVSLVRARHLFDEPEIWLQRGGETHVLRQNEHGSYEYVAGERVGQRVRLLHLDRLGVGAIPEPLHRDIRGLRYRLHFDQIRVQHITRDHLAVELRYGTEWVPTVLKAEGVRLEPECEIIAPGLQSTLNEARQFAARTQRVVQALREEMLAQVEERLPFDEPKTEVGQEDGKLRRLWRYAYLGGRQSYKLNGDRYWVFGPEGKPLVPQVCIDFLEDTIERASGTWWRPRGERRERVMGRFDFGREGDETMRRVRRFIEYAEEFPGRFEVYRVPPEEQLSMGYKRRFFKALTESALRYRSGDIVFIHGKTPWDEREAHYHSFYVYETDPLTHVPIAIVGNAGFPRIWSWEAEARRTPKRHVVTVVRPRVEWLDSIIPNQRGLSETPAPLVIDH